MTPRTPVRTRRRWFGKILIAVFSVVFFLCACEVALRIAWTNPYSLEGPGAQRFRLHRPSLGATVSARDLYAGGGEIRFATDGDRAVSSGRVNFASPAIALGGSTTESALVPEGGRWPDLVAGGARNYGVSGNTSIDSYRNLRWLADSRESTIKTVFLTHAINDLRALLGDGPDRFTVDAWSPAPVDLFSIDNPGQQVAFGLTIRDSWLLSAVRFAERESRGRNIFYAYSHNRDSQANLPLLADDAFDRFRQVLTTEFLPARARVFEMISKFAAAEDIRVVVCSQPHAYRPEYRPFVRDLRLYPVVNGHRMQLEQAAEAMAILNRHTVVMAARHRWTAADAAQCFAARGPVGLFYDSVHLTPSGSKLFAECVAAAVAEETSVNP